MKNAILNELDDDVLDNVSAGIEVGDEELIPISVWNDDMITYSNPSEENVV